MSLADSLRQQRSAPPAVWLQFVTAYQDNSEDLYAFFEGRDDFTFFMPELRRRWAGRGEIHPFRCNGKSDVLQIMPRIRQRLDREWRALFFVDKDVDDLVGVVPAPDPYLFQTECYSIENYLVTEHMVRLIWTDLFHLPAGDSRLGEVLARFRNRHAEFIEAIRIVMAWVIYQRRSGSRPLLSNVNLARVVSTNAERRIQRQAGWFSHLRQACGCEGPVDWGTVQAIDEELRRLDPKGYVRGKFELFFFVSFVNQIAHIVSERGGVGRAIIQVQLTHSNAVELLGGRSAPPPTLMAFLDRCLPGTDWN